MKDFKYGVYGVSEYGEYVVGEYGVYVVGVYGVGEYVTRYNFIVLCTVC